MKFESYKETLSNKYIQIRNQSFVIKKFWENFHKNQSEYQRIVRLQKEKEGSKSKWINFFISVRYNFASLVCLIIIHFI